MRLPGFSRMHGDQYAIDGVGPIEGSLILGAFRMTELRAGEICWLISDEGSWCRIAPQISPELDPSKGLLPLAISYSTAPNKKRSVRASSSWAVICPGDV